MHTQILDHIEIGVFVVNRQLDIEYWNRWLAFYTGISRETAVGNTLDQLFPNFSFKVLQQKVIIALKMGTPTFISGKVSGHVIPVAQYKVTKSIFRYMQQDATITPIDEDRVSIVITDVSPLLEARYTIDKQMRMLERQAKTDSLTGCFNKNMFNSMLAMEIKRCERHGRVFSLIIIDIDDFKKVNDSFGHLTGDAVLRELATLIGSSIRESDALIRWGGEEFFVLLPETTLEGGAFLADKQRKQIWAHKFENVGRLSCSFGVSQWNEGMAEDTIINNADTALYCAKNSNKNTVCMFSEGKPIRFNAAADEPVDCE